MTQGQDAGQIEASDMRTAWMATLAEMDKLKEIIGEYTFAGMKASCVRRREEDMGRTTLTDAMRLHPARKEDEDFMLEIWLCASAGHAISQAKTRSLEDLRILLGDYLFGAMEASNKRKDEERMGMLTCTNAVQVSSPNGKDASGDSKLEIMLQFEVGWQIWREAYPD